MSFDDRDWARAEAIPATQVTSFASLVYNWMATGLGLTACVAYFIYQMQWHPYVLGWSLPIILAQLGLVFAIQAGMRSMRFETLLTMFFAYSGLNGLIFGSILPLYALRYGADIVWVAFASCAAIFVAATLYGRSTRQDLTRYSSLLQFGLYGLIALSVSSLILSFFMNVSGMSLMIAYIGLVIFVGLMVTESQQIRRLSAQCDANDPNARRLALMCALGMYINIVTVFWYLLRILSASRD